MTYYSLDDKPLVWLKNEIKTPPFSAGARMQAGILLRKLQRGECIAMPHARPMPDAGHNCHELRIRDTERGVTWRIMIHIADEAVVIPDVFEKKRNTTPEYVIRRCRARLAAFYRDLNGE